MEKKLLFFDIDGTLACPGQNPSERTVSAIRRARAKGHKVFLGTGRSKASVPEAVREIGFDGGIYSAGGHVEAGSSVLSDQSMTAEMVRTICTAMETVNMEFSLECASKNYRRSPELSAAALSDMSGGSTELQRILASMDRNTLKDYQGEPVYKITFLARSIEQIETLAHSLDERFKVVHFSNLMQNSAWIAGEVSDRLVHKGLALKELCSYYGKSPAQSIAFGDSMNDAEMLLAAGIGVAMGDAEDRVKDLADQVCESCQEDGIARTLERMKLI